MLGIAGGVALGADAAPALAQNPPAEELVIIGQPRQAAPVAAATLDAEALSRRGVRTLEDAVAGLPGLSMIRDQDPGTNIVSLRGVTTDRLQAAAIAFVVDGATLADTEFFTLPLHDLEGVEVLRGPQGARFGRNASGGALAARTRLLGPGHVSVEIGDGGLRRLEAAAGKSHGSFAWRAAGRWSAADGWVENRTLGRVVDAEETRAGRLQAQLTAGGWRARLKTEAAYEDGGAAWASSGDVTGDFGGTLDGGALQDPIGDFEGRAARRYAHASIALEGPIGPARAQLLVARDDYAKRFIEELDYRPGPLTFFGDPIFPDGLQPIRQPVEIDVWTGEARLATSGARLEGEMGVFGQTLERRRTDDFGPLAFGAPPARYETEAALLAGFGRLAWRASDALRLEAQARFDRDERSQTITDEGGQSPRERREAVFERAQPRLAAAWTPTSDLTLYASWAQGYRAGGFNPTPSASALWRAEFAPEIAASAEIGAKWRSRGTRLEAAAFKTDVSDYQNYTFLDGQSVTLNVSAVEIAGFEIAGSAAGAWAGWDWRLDGGYALADAEIARYAAPNPLLPSEFRDYSGRQVPNAPLWTATIATGLTRGAVSADLAINATGETYFEIDNALRAPGKAWADARLAYAAGAWTVSLWAKNLTDERWAISAFGQGMLPLLQGLGPDGPFDTYTLNRGRRLGLELRREIAP